MFYFKMAETTAFLYAGRKAPGEKRRRKREKKRNKEERMNYWTVPWVE